MRAFRISVAITVGGLIPLLVAPGADAQPELQGAQRADAERPGERARARREAMKRHLLKLEREKARIEARIEAAKRELARAEEEARRALPDETLPDGTLPEGTLPEGTPPPQELPPRSPRGRGPGALPMPNPIPPPQPPRLFPRKPEAPGLREAPGRIPSPAPLNGGVAPGGIPEGWVPREFNGLRFYLIPLGGEADSHPPVRAEPAPAPDRSAMTR